MDNQPAKVRKRGFTRRSRSNPSGRRAAWELVPLASIPPQKPRAHLQVPERSAAQRASQRRAAALRRRHLLQQALGQSLQLQGHL